MSDNLETYFDLSLSRTFAVRGATVAPLDFSPGDAAAHFKRGTVLDHKYRIIQLLGEGGMGAVYSAHHLSLNKDVALKTFRSQQIDEASFQRFAREAQAIARLSHPNIVQVFDFGVTADHRPFYTMELLDGVSLAERIFKNPLSLRQTVRVFIDVAAGLAHAHKVGIIHRDIKPANIHLCEAPERPGEITAVKVVDFGIAKLAFGEEPGEVGQDRQMLTHVGLVFGSPLYMSPEQSLGLPTDQTTDIYSFGCALVESLTGEPPFLGANSFATMVAHQSTRPPKLADRKPDVAFPRRLESLVACLLEKDRALRFQTFAEVKEELEAVLFALNAERAAQGGESATLPAQLRQATVPSRTTRAFTTAAAPGSLERDKSRAATAAASGTASIFGGKKILIGLAVLLLVIPPVVFFISRVSLPPRRLATAPAPLKAAAAPVQNSAQKVTPYLVETKGGIKTFVFPEDPAFGYLEIGPKLVPASGKVEVPAALPCGFLAEASIDKHPELLSGFGPHDLTAIRFDENCTAGDEHLKIISDFIDLNSLDVQNCKLSAASMVAINKLKNLRKLTIFPVGITLEQWSTLKVLPQIERLVISEFGDVGPLLAKLVNGNAIVLLDMQWCPVKDSDMACLSRFKKLERLQINFGDVTDTGVAFLRDLPRLSFIKIGTNKMSSASVDTFAHMPALKTLILGVRRWPIATRAKLATTMRAKNIGFEGTDY